MKLLPWIKWVGGKRKMRKRIGSMMPDEIDHYVEPFLGGGAVFLYLLGEGLLRAAMVADQCFQLVNMWRHVQSGPAQALELAKSIENTAPAFYAARARYNALRRTPGVELAGLFLYLNAAAYGGVHRVKARPGGKPEIPVGGYNVPWGKRPRLAFNEDALWAAHEALNSVPVRIVCAGFETTMGVAPSPAVRARSPRRVRWLQRRVRRGRAHGPDGCLARGARA